MGIRPSMGTVGSLKTTPWPGAFSPAWSASSSSGAAGGPRPTCIEGWYNPRRRHSGLGQVSPASFERKHQEKPCTPAPSAEDDLTTVGVCVAGATPPVDKSAQEAIQPA